MEIKYKNNEFFISIFLINLLKFNILLQKKYIIYIVILLIF